MIRNRIGCAVEVAADHGFFITLNNHGQFSAECISNGTIRLLNAEIPHQMCLDGNWGEASRYFPQSNLTMRQHAIQQVKAFYEHTGSTIWITSDGTSLWWCFAEPNVSVSTDGSRVRKALGGWNDKDILGCPLLLDRVDQNRLQVRNHKSAISRIREVVYVVDLINGNANVVAPHSRPNTMTDNTVPLKYQALFHRVKDQRSKSKAEAIKAFCLELSLIHI